MTGDDRPFGIRSPTDVRQEVEESRDRKLAARQVKDAYTTLDVEEGNEQEHAAGKKASASWDAVKEGNDGLGWSDSQQDSSQVQKDIERAYLQYKQQHPVNPQVKSYSIKNEVYDGCGCGCVLEYVLEYEW